MYKFTALIVAAIMFVMISCSSAKRMQKNKMYFNMAFESESSGDYKVAEELYSKAISYHPKDTTSYNNRGTCKYHLGKAKEALNDYEKALQLDKNNYRAYANRAMIRYDEENYAEAINDYNKALEIKPGYINALMGKGSVYHKKRDYRTAVECYTRVINADSTNAYAFYNRGASYFEWEKLNAACADWHKANQLGYSEAKVLMRKHCSK